MSRPDPNVEAVKRRLDDRSARGMEKYGVSTARSDLSMAAWLRHLQEELLDAVVYIEAALPPRQPVADTKDDTA